MNTLTLLIDERWPDILMADWVLSGSRGNILQEGSSEPRHWPAAERRVAVLAGAQVSLCALKLPASRRQDRERLIAYALEDRLPSDTDGQHFTLLEQDGDLATVAVIESERLRRVVAAFSAVGHPLSAAYGRLQSLPQLQDTAACVVEGAMRYWRWPDGSGLAEDAHPGMELVSWAVRKSLAATPALRVQGPEDVANALGLPCSGESESHWYLVSSARSLLHGQFIPRESGGSRRHRLRWPLWLAGSALGLHLSIGVGAAMVARGSESELNAKVLAIFAAAFPGATVVDPVLQMRRQLNEIRPRIGELRDDDMLVLLAALSESLPAGSMALVAKLRYETGALELTLSAAIGDQERRSLIGGLNMRGIVVQGASNSGDGLLKLKRGSH